MIQINARFPDSTRKLYIYKISNVLEMQVTELISIQSTFIPLTSWTWWYNLHIFRLWYGKITFNIRLILIERNGNIPVFADVVKHAAYIDHLANLERKTYADLAV